GPWAGVPVAFNTVLAGRNTLAVDRVALASMGMAQTSVRYLNYMSLLGRGPTTLSEVSVLGDTLTPKTFALPDLLPISFDPARVTPATFAPGQGQSTAIQIKYYQTCIRQVAILQVRDDTTAVTLIRTVAASAAR